MNDPMPAPVVRAFIAAGTVAGGGTANSGFFAAAWVDPRVDQWAVPDFRGSDRSGLVDGGYSGGLQTSRSASC
jgi:hypothetical protein